MLYCMNVPDGKSAEVAENLEYLKEKHSLDRVWDRSIQPFYERTQIRNPKSFSHGQPMDLFFWYW